jgi:hypothetical protein
MGKKLPNLVTLILGYACIATCPVYRKLTRTPWRWSSGFVFTCEATGREIESRQGMGCLKKENSGEPNTRLHCRLLQTNHKIFSWSIPCMYIQLDYLLSIAQSFSPFLARDGRQVCRPSWIWATSLCYILLYKFVALVGSGRQTCRPSRDKKGLKDWANTT